MKRNLNRGVGVIMAVWLLAIACNLPISAPQAPAEPTLSSQELALTAASIALTAQAGDTGNVTAEPTLASISTSLPATSAPTATLCFAMVTANMNVNVRTGPNIVYDAVGYIPAGGTALVAGQNDARTWWYIEFPSGSGRYAWVAGSVTIAACIPAALQVVAAPPLPTAPPPTATIIPPVAAKPDLIVSEYSWSPVPPHMGISFHVRIGAYNDGNGPSGAFTVQWWLSTSAPSPTCTWNVASLPAHGGRILQCDYTPGGWNNAYPSMVVVDSGHVVDESNEGNNTWSQPLQIAP